MGRRVHPRHKTPDGEEYLILLQSNTLGKLHATQEAIKTLLPGQPVVVEKAITGLADLLDLAMGWWSIETARELYIFDCKAHYHWCVEDVLENQLNYKWLSRKAARYEQKIVDYLNAAERRQGGT